MNPSIKSVFYGDPELMAMLETREKAALLDKLVANYQFIQGEKGDTPSEEELRALILSLIPEPIPGEKGDSIIGPAGPIGKRGLPGRDGIGIQGIPGTPGKDGKDAEITEIDRDELLDELVDKIKKGKLLDISNIKNASSFMKDGIRYKIEELMHGGGSSTTSGLNVTTQYLLTAVHSGSDVTIAFSQLTNFATFSAIIALYRNNVPQTLGIDFSATASSATIFNADASEIFNLTYSFS